MDSLILDDEINCEETEGSAFAMPAVDKNCAMLAFSLFDEADYSTDDILVDDILNIVLSPVEGEKAHSFDSCVVLSMPSCAVDDVSDLIKGQPLYVLSHWWCT